MASYADALKVLEDTARSPCACPCRGGMPCRLLAIMRANPGQVWTVEDLGTAVGRGNRDVTAALGRLIALGLAVRLGQGRYAVLGGA